MRLFLTGYGVQVRDVIPMNMLASHCARISYAVACTAQRDQADVMRTLGWCWATAPEMPAREARTKFVRPRAEVTTKFVGATPYSLVHARVLLALPTARPVDAAPP